MYKQRTLENTITTKGSGLHTGARVELTLHPAPIDTGIVFRRSDLPGSPSVPAIAHQVGDTRLSTLLRKGDASISTVEHLMSALAGLGIDNAYIDVAGPEIPIMDGSAGPFIYLLQSAGIVEQYALKKFIRVLSVVEVSDGDKWARFTPYDGFLLDFTIDFMHPALGHENSRIVLDFGENAYIKDIARARTFGFMQDLEAMRSAGLAMGGSLHNAVVLDETSVLNSGGLRYENEPVRHKILDAIGDLYLLGHPVIGQYTAYKSGHALNNALARALLENKKAYEIVSFRAEEAPKAYQQWRLSHA
ncbi:MAG: UDP-3-O-acyl-N-acetylglucosamine deacetylase [Burkholderiales bacterium]|jgi:UDP-3-O-[3-hydroxymyristoyl] N-acetylglucosamine deacetylase|nr:UDP-3-O-acyl-N-acetylglucosamine deacetylase [Burkholderiales bacterium]